MRKKKGDYAATLIDAGVCVAKVFAAEAISVIRIFVKISAIFGFAELTTCGTTYVQGTYAKPYLSDVQLLLKKVDATYEFGVFDETRKQPFRNAAEQETHKQPHVGDYAALRQGNTKHDEHVRPGLTSRFFYAETNDATTAIFRANAFERKIELYNVISDGVDVTVGSDHVTNNENVSVGDVSATRPTQTAKMSEHKTILASCDGRLVGEHKTAEKPRLSGRTYQKPESGLET